MIGKMGIRFKVLILTLTILIATISLSSFVIVLKEKAQLKESLLNNAGEIIQLSFPIAVDNTIIGQVIMGISLTKVNSRISSMIYFMSVVNLCSILIAFFLLSRSLRTITVSVIELANLVQRVSKDKDYSLCATIKRNDELGYLSDGLNEMLSRINQRDKELNAILNNIPDIPAALLNKVREVLE